MTKVGKLIKRISPAIYEELAYCKNYLVYCKRKNTKASLRERAIAKDFKKHTGDSIDFRNPKSYSEKIQWLKLYDDNPYRSTLTDKVLVREWIKEQIGEKYLMPIIGVYDSFDDIDFNNLPSRFVIKANHGSGWNIIVNNKETFNIKAAKKKVNRWLKIDYAFWTEYEVHYSPIKPKIIIENYVSDHNGELVDYKFLCFNGECKFFWIDFDRATNHKRNVYDMDWNLQPWNQYTYGNYEGQVTKPENFDDMVRVVNILCKGFRHVRVDLYNVDGRVYFGEMTFTNGSGFEGIFPKEYDYKIGDLINLD